MTIYNFNAGPACLPKTVLNQIKADLPEWQEGVSVLEFGHRLPEIVALRERIESKLRALLNIDDSHDILLMHGGAQTIFSLIPMHFLSGSETANYLVTGLWSKMAAQEAQRLAKLHIALDLADNQYMQITDESSWRLNSQAVYTYYCDNETVHGVAFQRVPSINGQGFLVADMTSSLGSFEIDLKQYGLVFASTQKNLGVSGLALVIIDKSLIKPSVQNLPKTMMFSYMSQSQSMLNTPNVFAWYVLDLMLSWVEASGGVSYFQERAKRLSQLVYETIDKSDLYVNRVAVQNRSLLNIPFDTVSEATTQQFLKLASQNGLKFLKGHREVGGLRANIYNAMPEDGVRALIEFMQYFESDHA